MEHVTRLDFIAFLVIFIGKKDLQTHAGTARQTKGAQRSVSQMGGTYARAGEERTTTRWETTDDRPRHPPVQASKSGQGRRGTAGCKSAIGTASRPTMQGVIRPSAASGSVGQVVPRKGCVGFRGAPLSMHVVVTAGGKGGLASRGSPVWRRRGRRHRPKTTGITPLTHTQPQATTPPRPPMPATTITDCK